jgi:hypothetical protein
MTTIPGELPKDVSAVADALGNYGLTDFERDISGMKPRFVDIWVIPPLMMYAAWKSKGAVNRWTRRALFTAGVYMMYRNYAEYKSSLSSLAAIAQGQPSSGTPS